LKLSFINEVAAISSAVGASIQDVATGIGLDRRIGRAFLNAGIGWGGSCLGKDLRAFISISREYGLPTQILDAALAVNERQRGVAIRLLQEELHLLKGSRIGLLGLAFKPGTDDLRDAPSLDIARRLLTLGAGVAGYDPAVREVPVPGVTMVASAADLAKGADALLLITEWDQFADLDWPALAATMRRRIVIDGRNSLDPARLEAAGIKYRAIGR
jgi:UDPglucose 6-dehydrogenase